MIFEHIGLNQINGSLVVLDGVKGASYEEMVELRLEDGTSRAGRIVKIDGELVVIQVFEGTRGISMNNSTTVLSGFLNSVDTTLFALPMAVAKETSVGGTSSFSKEPDILSLPPMDAMPRPI